MLTEMQTELKNQLERFRKEKIEPFLEEDDRNEIFKMDIYRELGSLGYTGMPIEELYGGASLTYQDFCVALTELAQSSVSYAVTISVSVMVQGIIQEFGNTTQKNLYLPELTSGQEIGAFALTESAAGSDATALKMTAKKSSQGYILNGAKIFITSAGIAKTYIVMARTGVAGAKGISAFIVQRGTKGFSIGKKEKKMGWKVSPTCELIFENCLIPHENLLYQEGHGFKIAASALDKGRITIGSIAVGVCERALTESMKYTLERTQFNKNIFEFQGLQFMLAEMATETQASALLVQLAAKNYDRGEKNKKFASMAKLKATDTAMKVTIDAVQIHGGAGYTCEYPVERLMRDAKVLQIVEGTNQIQKIIIARQLKKEYT